MNARQAEWSELRFTLRCEKGVRAAPDFPGAAPRAFISIQYSLSHRLPGLGTRNASATSLGELGKPAETLMTRLSEWKQNIGVVEGRQLKRLLGPH